MLRGAVHEPATSKQHYGAQFSWWRCAPPTLYSKTVASEVAPLHANRIQDKNHVITVIDVSILTLGTPMTAAQHALVRSPRGLFPPRSPTSQTPS